MNEPDGNGIPPPKKRLAEFSDPCRIEPTPVKRQPPAGIVRLALGMIPEQRHYSVPSNFRAMCRMAEQAGRAGADLLAFEELALTLFVPRSQSLVAVPGTETRGLGKIARKYRMYIAVTLRQKLPGGHSGNVVVLINRQGQIQKIYRKIQLTDGEIKGGGLPGVDALVAETDFGRVSFLICYDTQFPELTRLLGVQGADLVICPHVGGAGPHSGDVIGCADAYRNGYWLAWVGRYVTGVIDPWGEPVARMNEAGRLLITDLALRQPKITVFASRNESVLDWRSLQYHQRRPEMYRQELPPVEIHSTLWPRYCHNQLPQGRTAIPLQLVNVTGRRQTGVLRVDFPVPQRYLSAETHPALVNFRCREKWWVSPASLRFDLKPHGRTVVALQADFPKAAHGFYLVRLSGKTREGDRVFWQRQLHSFPAPRRITIPHLGNARAILRGGALLPLKRDFFNQRANSRTTLRLGWTDRGLVLHAVARRLGRWATKGLEDPECITFALKSEEKETCLYWLTVYRDGRTTAQRREHGAPVKGWTPPWQAVVKRRTNAWEVSATVPFGSGLPAPRVGTSWQMNFERHALLTNELEALRHWATVRSPKSGAVSKNRSRGCEWAAWNPTWSRVDSISALGIVSFGE